MPTAQAIEVPDTTSRQDELRGRIAVVTGASRGIGAATARALAAEGAAVAIVFRRDQQAAEQVSASIRAAGGEAEVFQADVSDEGQVRRLSAEVIARFGRIDVLVNNAGVFGARALEELDAAFFLEQFSQNALSVMLLTRAFAPHFGAGGGSIFNVSSNLTQVPRAGTGVYAASKAAVSTLTRAFATELGPRGIRVNAVAPSLTRTDMTAAVPQENKDGAATRTPLRRIGEPEDIAAAIICLAGERMGWVTGQTVLTDGGFTGAA